MEQGFLWLPVYTRCDYKVIHLLSGAPEGNYGTVVVAVHFIIINCVVPLCFHPCTHHQLKRLAAKGGPQKNAAQEYRVIHPDTFSDRRSPVSPLVPIYSYINRQ